MSSDGLAGLRDEVAAMSSNMFKVRFPVFGELKDYSVNKFRHDLIAGATLTLVSVPQAIGFSLILGLPPMTVIMSVVIGGFVSALFFSSHHHVFGPTTSVCLITVATMAANANLGLPPLELAAYMAFLIGAAQFLAGLLNFGEITKFISRSMVVGYTSGIGVLLISSQMHNLLGFSAAPGQKFLAEWEGVFLAVFDGRASLWALGVGVLTLVLFEGLARFRPRWPEALIVLAVLGIASQLYAQFDATLPYKIVSDEGALVAGLPRLLGLPSLSEQFTLFPHIAGTVVAVAIIGMLEATAITKGLAAKSGQLIEPNQELMGMGAGNLLCGLFGGSPASSSFSRSAVNYQSGAASQLSSMLSSVLVLVILLFLTPIFNHIPVAALAVHLMRVGYKLINRAQIRVAVRSTRSDAVVFVVTLASALLLPLDTAIYVGIGVAIALFLQKTTTPILAEYSFSDTGHLTALRHPEQRPDPEISIIHVEGELYFGAADLFQSQIRRQAEDQNIRIIILRMRNARHLDATTVMALDSLHDYLRQTNRHLLISGCNAQVVQVLMNSGMLKKIGADNIFPLDLDNPNMATRRALLRAKSLLPEQHADVRVFYERDKLPPDAAPNPPPAS